MAFHHAHRGEPFDLARKHFQQRARRKGLPELD